MEYSHKPVLLEECLEGLNIREDGIYIDGTLGGAGHSSEILVRLGENGMLIGLDQDATAIEVSRGRLEALGSRARFVLENTNFINMAQVASKLGIEAVDGILLDLGVSSHQLDEPKRGFSYQHDAPLDMRMDTRQELTAETVVNEYSEQELYRIIRDYGEERWAKRIASFIADYRRNSRITTTSQLVDIIKAAIPASARREGPHPAKRMFQAIRIEVNNELGILEEAINTAVDLLKPGGRICIITFHSLEDRIVKKTFQKLSDPCTCPPEFPACICGKKPLASVLTRKPVVPGKKELEENPRARSAKLRILEKL